MLFPQRQHRAAPFVLGNRAELHALDTGKGTVLLNDTEVMTEVISA
jgi:hypothetical protein